MPQIIKQLKNNRNCRKKITTFCPYTFHVSEYPKELQSLQVTTMVLSTNLTGMNNQRRKYLVFINLTMKSVVLSDHYDLTQGINYLRDYDPIDSRN